MATGDDVQILKVREDTEGKVSVQNLNDVIRRLYRLVYALEGRTEESTIRNNLTVMGSISNTGMAEPDTSVSGNGKIYFDTSAGHYKVSENGTGFRRLSQNLNVVTPAIITIDQNAYTPGEEAYYWRLETDAVWNINGISSYGVLDGTAMVIVNVGSNDLILVDKSGAALEQDRILCPNAVDITLSADMAAWLFRDNATNRWRAFQL